MVNSELLLRLEPNQRRGSKPRCHLLTHADRATSAARLTSLVSPHGRIDSTDFWLPDGFTDTNEPKLGETPGLLSDEHREAVTAWWLEVRPYANTPNWDIAGTCDIAGTRGLFLVEAKAHLNELPIAGKAAPTTENGRKNHERTRKAIEDANAAIGRVSSGWCLSRDSHYQLSNRLAWSWKVASLGVPVILVYLGFLSAGEMEDQGPQIASDAEWTKAMHAHSKDVVPITAWGQTLDVNGTSMIPLIRSMRLDLAASPTKGACV